MKSYMKFGVLAALLALSACVQPVYDANGYPVQSSYPCPGGGTNTAVGVAGGAVVGGLLGNAAGGRRGSFGRTALGALAGGAAGGLIGNATEPRCTSAPNYGYGNPSYGYSSSTTIVTSRPVYRPAPVY